VPVEATPVTARMLTRQRIRMAMRDVAGAIPKSGSVNVLLDDVEFSDDEIDNAILFTVDWYNSLTPISVVQQDAINSYVLYMGVVSFLMMAESMRQLRNQASLQDGDVAPIGADDKHTLYAQASQVAAQKFEERAQKIKIQLNMESCYGSLGSGYAGTSRTHG